MKTTFGIMKNPLFIIVFMLLNCSLVWASGTSITESDSGWHQVPAILENLSDPQFPNQEFDILDYGAIGDGKTDCSQAFVLAIDACHQAGGGKVVVPTGTFLTGAIHLKSNVNLYVSSGATILFSTDTKDYLPLVYTRFEGIECMNYSPLIYAFQAENIAVTGSGKLDGQAGNDNWWIWKGQAAYGWKKGDPRQHGAVARLNEMAENGTPVNERIFGDGHFLRSSFIQPYHCKNVLIDSVTIVRSPMWEVHPVLCENVTVRNVKIKSHGPNNDGCNPESSRNVLIENCYFDTGDDCIAIKSGRNGDGRRIARPSENIIVRNCTMKDGHGGVVIGSEMSGSVRNVFIENCVMDSPHLERALRIKTNSMRGGIVENIYMRDITVGEVSDAIIRVFFHYERGDVGEHTPEARNIFMTRVTSKKSTFAILLDGYERSPITNVQLRDCQFNGVKKGNVLNHVAGLKLENVFINGELLEE